VVTLIRCIIFVKLKNNSQKFLSTWFRKCCFISSLFFEKDRTEQPNNRDTEKYEGQAGRRGHTCNAGTWEVEAKGSQVQALLGLHNEPLSQ
jgi:hypothetical protein